MYRIISSYVLLLVITCRFVNGDPKVPCFFIFGDSLVDAGNNNNLITTTKSNYPPYGVDFPGGLATGRFTNGLTQVDIITRLLGMEGLIPPFSTASGIKLLKGVNYASGGAGILPETDLSQGDRIWLAKQVQNHEITISELESFVKGPVSKYLNKCLYTVSMGSNDYLNNYFLAQSVSPKKVLNPYQFATTLVAEYEPLLKKLYNYGARKTAIFGISNIGCTPAAILRKHKITCVQEINQAVQLFNKKLLSLVDSLNLQLVGAKFTFIDVMAMPSSLDFKTGATCCKLSSDYACEPLTPPCPDRNLYAYMDGFHPTQAVNQHIAESSFYSPSNMFVHPVDINTLVSL